MRIAINSVLSFDLRTYFLLGTLVLLMPSFAAADSGYGPLTDKVAHVGVGMAVQLGTYGLLKQQGVPRLPALLLGGLAGAGVGVLKEMSDRRFDVGDAAATAGGAVLGMGLVLGFDF